METRFQTNSFIPKASLENAIDDNGKIQRSSGSTHDSSSLFILVSFFIFICSIVSAGIVFSLDQLATSQKKTANDSLVKSQESIKKDTIEEIKALSSRLGVVSSLLERHVAVSYIFNELSKNTIKQVSFNSFDLKRKTDNTFHLSLKAQGIGYEAIVAQSTQLSSGQSSKFFKNTSVTDFVKTKGQDITSFGIETTISGNSIVFSEVINNTLN